MQKLHVKLVKSPIGSKPVHKKNLEALGLRKLRAVLMQCGKLDFRQLDKLVGKELCGKTKMSPLELSLILDSAA